MQTLDLDYVDIIQPKFLTKEFLSKYANRKPPFTTVFGLVVFLRTYSRFIPELKRREYWWETVTRVVDYSMSLYKGPASFTSLKEEAEELYDYIYNLKVFPAGRTLWVGGVKGVNGISQFNCSFRVIDSVEAYSEIFYILMVGCGSGFSIESQYVNQLPKLNVDFKVNHSVYNPLPKLAREENTTIYCKDNKGLQLSVTSLNLESLVDIKASLLKKVFSNKAIASIEIEVGDSKESWCNALKSFLYAVQYSNINEITFNYDSIRPQGEIIKGFGGRASGPASFKKMLQKIIWTIKNSKGNLSTVDAMDISNFIAEGVVAGGTRRSAQIALGDVDDQLFINAKYDLWSYKPGINTNGHTLTSEQVDYLENKYINFLNKFNINRESIIDDGIIPAIVSKYNIWDSENSLCIEASNFVNNLDPKFRYRESRVMSNNSIHAYDKLNIKDLFGVFNNIKNNGEPALVIAGNAQKKRPNYAGVNPCVEILLANFGLCNLVTEVIKLFVKGKDQFDYEGFYKAIKLATRMASRITNVELWHPEWDKVQKRDRLLGVSITGQVEAWDELGWGYELDKEGNYTYKTDFRIVELLKEAKRISIEEAHKYHSEMRIPAPLLVTAIKPEGTISQLPTVSSGVHRPYAPYYLRRIRVSKHDPLAQALKDSGIPVCPENSQGNDLYAEECNTWVFTFPIKTQAPIRAIDEPAIAQLERYKMLMESYTDHNTSITVTVEGDQYNNEGEIVKKGEWDEVVNWVHNNWDTIVAVSFLPKWDPVAGGQAAYPNLPYQPSTKEEYEELNSKINLSENELLELIAKYETVYEEQELGSDCNSGACPVR